MNELIIPDGFLANERIFIKTIEFILSDMDIEDNFLFISDQRLGNEVLKIVDHIINQLEHAYDNQKEQYSDSFNDYLKKYMIEVVLTAKIKEIIIEDNNEVLKYREHRTKMNATNLVLLEILLNLNDTSEQLTDCSDPESLPEVKNNKIYNLSTSKINKALHLDYFISEELKLRVAQKNHEFTINKKIAGLTNKLKALEGKYYRERKKIITNRRSYIKKLRRAKQDLYSKPKKLEGKEREDLYSNLLSSLNEGKTAFLKLKSTSFKELEELKKAHEDKIAKLKLKKNLSKYLSDRKKFKEENKSLDDRIESLRKTKADFFNNKPVKKEKCEEEKDKFYLFEDEMLLPNPLNIPEGCISREELNKFKKNKRDIFDNCLDYLKSYNLIDYNIVNEKNDYELNLDSWFSSQKHHLSNLNIIKELLPLLISYLKYNEPHKVDSFLSHIDEIIDYLFLSPEKFSTEYEKDLILLKALTDKRSINISVIEDGEDTFFNNVSDYKLEFDEDGDKNLNWSYNNKNYSKTLDDINSITIEIKGKKDVETEKEEQVGTSLNKKLNTFSIQKQKYNTPDRKKYKAILEVDIILTDFFTIKPLKNQVIYKTQLEIKQFLKENALLDLYKENKIYVSIEDTSDDIIHVVKRCIPNVKILEPIEINNKFKAMIKPMCE